VARYIGTTGALDTTFGTNGVQVVNPTAAINDGVRQGIVLPDDSIIVAGGVDTGVNTKFGAVKFTPSGAVDTTFGTNGLQTYDLDTTPRADAALDVALGSDGKIMLAGYRTNATSDELATIRLESTTMTDFTTWGAANQFGICLRSFSGAGSSVSAWAAATGNNCGTGVAGDDANWHAVPTATTKVLQTSTPNTTNVTANFRFGVKLPSTQAAGSYMAPITFEVVAPNS
jgi:uncharacterized delta-60 repeat protein